MGNIGPTELLLILLIVILLFGAKRIPELAKGLGRGIREFKNAARHSETEDTDSKETDDESKK